MAADAFAFRLDPASGAVVSLHDRRLGVELVSEPRLARSFSLLLPTPSLQANYVVGLEQRAPKVEEVRGGVDVRWRGPLQATVGEVDIDVLLELRGDGPRLESRLVVENRSPYPLGEVWHPVVGGFTGIGAREATQTLIPIAGWTADTQLLQRFRGNGWELGTPIPEYLFKYPGELPMQWVAFWNDDVGGGAYVGCHDTVARFKTLRLALSPGSGHLREDPWPREDEADGLPVGVEIDWVFFPYTPTGGTFAGPPVVVQTFEGDWTAAAAIYRDWFTSQFTLTDPRASRYRAQSAIQDTMFLLPEGNVTHTFADMGRWARDASERGVRSVMLSGWHRGGHDNGYPMYEPDERLGSWQDLEAGIRACHDEGVEVYFFVNVQPVDCDTDWYREELHRYRSVDPWGVSVPMGWGMGTIGARLGATRRPSVFASASFPEYRRIVVDQMRRLAEIGADGVHIDKLAWSIVLLDFNPELPAPPDQAPWQGILDATDEILAACRDVNPEFSISAEGPWDRLLAYTDVFWVWHSTWEDDHLDAFKRTFPQWLPALAVAQPYDFNVVNNAVRFGYQLLVGPAHYTRSLADPPMRRLGEYIREVQQLRDELADVIFFGEYLAGDGVAVTASGRVHYAVHRDPRTGTRACVVVNLDPVARRCTVAFDGGGPGEATVRRPGAAPARAAQPVALELPPEGLAIVVADAAT
jgi:hypothetical protein